MNKIAVKLIDISAIASSSLLVAKIMNFPIIERIGWCWILLPAWLLLAVIYAILIMLSLCFLFPVVKSLLSEIKFLFRRRVKTKWQKLYSQN
ncbi:hypothetical protein SAMN05216311_114173 [Chitinophaga sp. CF418]|nr:hypothetical protein SAMN05216311_114173 [Chitinophaga sp. CF418]